MTAALFDLPAPPSLNNLYINVPKKGRVKSSKYREWFKEAGGEIILQRVGFDNQQMATLTGVREAESYEVTIHVHVKTRADIDNLAKPILDTLVQMNVTPDDKHCQSVTVMRSELPPKGRCVVTIRAAKREAA